MRQSPRGRYVSASELAEYAYCPRSHYYSQHREGRPVAAGAAARERAGVVYHSRTIGSDRRWTAASPLPWVVALLAGVLLVGVVLLGGIP